MVPVFKGMVIGGISIYIYCSLFIYCSVCIEMHRLLIKQKWQETAQK